MLPQATGQAARPRRCNHCTLANRRPRPLHGSLGRPVTGHRDGSPEGLAPRNAPPRHQGRATRHHRTLANGYPRPCSGPSACASPAPHAHACTRRKPDAAALAQPGAQGACRVNGNGNPRRAPQAWSSRTGRVGGGGARATGLAGDNDGHAAGLCPAAMPARRARRACNAPGIAASPGVDVRECRLAPPSCCGRSIQRCPAAWRPYPVACAAWHAAMATVAPHAAHGNARLASDACAPGAGPRPW